MNGLFEISLNLLLLEAHNCSIKIFSRLKLVTQGLQLEPIKK